MANVLRTASALRNKLRKKEMKRIDVWINLDESNSHNGYATPIACFRAARPPCGAHMGTHTRRAVHTWPHTRGGPCTHVPWTRP